MKDDSLKKNFRSLAQKLREIILKQKVAILSGTPVKMIGLIFIVNKLMLVRLCTEMSYMIKKISTSLVTMFQTKNFENVIGYFAF